MDFVAPLFVPASRPDRFAKAAASGADAIILDLEDAVSPQDKEAARQALRADFTDLPVLVRINAVGTAWHEADLAAALGAGFSALIVSKAELSEGFSGVCLAAREAALPVLPLVESARGMADARAIAATAGVGRLVFGSIDYSADIGCAHTREALLCARSELVLASRLAGLAPPVDGVTAAIGDAALVGDDAAYGRTLGFGAKLAIHPAQIEPILSAFRPSAEEIGWARRVLASGDGAVAVDGSMVDEPVRIRARGIMRLAGL